MNRRQFLKMAGMSGAMAIGAGPALATTAERGWSITIHHTATPADRPGERLASIRDYHTRVKGWTDIGYHLLVGEDGSLWFGRSLDRTGAHVKGQNERNIGLAFIGDYVRGPTREPPPAALQSARAILAVLQRAYDVPRERIYFHRDLAATACPGPWEKGLLLEAIP